MSQRNQMSLTSLSARRPFHLGDGVEVANADVLEMYGRWPAATVIVSDGAYGVSGFEGDPPTASGLAEWYAPHVAEWSRLATPETTLWFWNTELGWATVHPILAMHGWEYRCANIWDKGLAHVAGNCNTVTLRKLPVVTEVCVQYTRQVRFQVGPRSLSMKEWLRYEWERSGLPLYKTNEACGVKNAATRKYFTQDHLWYFPPPEAFEQFAAYANEKGRPAGRPYFSLSGTDPIPAAQWARMRAKFSCPVGVSNVWREPAVRGEERLKTGSRAFHLNQKPLSLMRRIIEISSDPGDVVWEPFGGLCTASLAALLDGRRAFAAEINPEFFAAAIERLGDA